MVVKIAIIGNITGSAFDIAVQYMATYVFGSPLATGVYLLTFLFLVLMSFRIQFVIGIVILVPTTVVLAAAGFVEPLVAGIHILVVLVALGLMFFRGR